MFQPLLLLANEGTDAGRIIASHALAKIAITQNPEIAFPGQRVCTLQCNNLFYSLFVWHCHFWVGCQILCCCFSCSYRGFRYL